MVNHIVTTQLSRFLQISHFHLVLAGAFVIQIGMQSVAVVEHGYIIKYILLCLISGLLVPPLHSLLLQAAKEAFSNCFVPAISFSTHAANKTMGF